jgi:hypothetical protein
VQPSSYALQRFSPVDGAGAEGEITFNLIDMTNR